MTIGEGMKNILVSGAGGFLGVELVKQLANNDDVKVFALSGQKDRLSQIFGSHGNFELVSNVPQGVDVFINCVFPANANGMQLASGLDYITDLYLETRVHNVKSVINISTQRVYPQDKEDPATEDTTPDLGPKYAVGKYAVEKLTNAIFHDIPHTNMRMASLIGPNSDSRISNRFVKQVMEGNDIHIVADKQMFGFLDVRDAATGIAKYALSDAEKWEETLNLGSGNAYSLEEIAECVVNVGIEFGFNSSIVIGDETGDIRNSMLDGSRLRNIIEWKAEIPLEKTVRDTYIHYMKENS